VTADDTKMALENFFFKFGERTYKKGDIVIRADDQPTGVFFLKSGHVKMSSTFKNGTETAVNIFKPGTFFPMTWLIGGIPNDYSYTAITNIKLFKAPKDEFEAFLKANPEILFDLMRRVFIGLDGMLFSLKYLLHGNSYERVAVVLYMAAKRFGSGKNRDVQISIPLTHFDVSHYAGLTRETTTIMINKLAKAKLISQKKRKITVADTEALAKVFMD